MFLQRSTVNAALIGRATKRPAGVFVQYIEERKKALRRHSNRNFMHNPG